MTDPIAAAARAAAGRLTAEYGPGLTVDVEAALHARAAGQRPDQYLDPVSVSSLIVSIATLAWSIYSDLKKRTPKAPPDAIARTLRVELANRGGSTPAQQITDVVVTEIIQAADDSL